MSEFEEYNKHFPPGMKVIVAIPMRNHELFRDTAVIHEIDEDVVSLQLSRDVLPVDINLQTGKILELRGGKDGYAYRCNGNLVSEGTAGAIIVRLTGSINSAEQREYFRIEAFLPVKIQLLRGQSLDAVLKEWRSRRETRIADDLERREQLAHRRRERIIRIAEEGRRSQEQSEEEEFDESDFLYPEWSDVNAMDVNISGGGFKFVTSEHYELDDLVLCEAFIPANPPRIMDCVARVAFKNRNYAVKDDQEFFNIALQFMFLEERDRDAVVSHISRLQLMRIGQLRQKSLLVGREEAGDGQERFWFFKMAAFTLLVIGFFAVITSYLVSYSRDHVKNDIQKSFEESINTILHRLK
jgi:hypothetical protein